MNLQERIELLSALGKYLLSDDDDLKTAKEKAFLHNKWFTPEFTDLATRQIAEKFLEKSLLENWISAYAIQPGPSAQTIGIVMAGNIPLVGFHDLLCVFISGHKARIKASSKDDVLIRHLAGKLISWNESTRGSIQFEEMLKGCDAYIATGSNNSSRYFQQYFGKFPHIIRRNRTSAAVLTGNESQQDLEKLADDVYTYFGRGCRNVSKIYVPENYDFVPLLRSFDKYNYFQDHNQYKNNYDYNLALHILNHKFYMSNESIILFEHESLFSPISQLHYEFYTDKNDLTAKLKTHEDLQCLVGHDGLSFGLAQFPSLTDYADAVDTIRFLQNL